MTNGAAKSRGDKPSVDVPDLELPVSQQRTRTAPAATHEPTSAIQPQVSPYAGDLDSDDDDDLVVDRNVMPDAVSMNVSRGAPLAPLGRLELGATVAPDSRIAAGSHAKVTRRRFYMTLAANAFVVAAVASAAEWALLRYVHRAAGWNALALAPSAFDGGSALWSGATSLGALAVCIALAIAGMYSRPRSYGYLLASAGMLVAAAAMMTVTFSVGPDGAPEVPPDGSRLVPWAMPLVPLGVALRLLWTAWDRCDEGRLGERATGGAFAIAAAAAVFAAVELAYGAGIGRLVH